IPSLANSAPRCRAPRAGRPARGSIRRALPRPRTRLVRVPRTRLATTPTRRRVAPKRGSPRNRTIDEHRKTQISRHRGRLAVPQPYAYSYSYAYAVLVRETARSSTCTRTRTSTRPCTGRGLGVHGVTRG